MSSFYKDPRRKVSEPTEADFIRGMASSASKHSSGANLIWALAAGLLVGKKWRNK